MRHPTYCAARELKLLTDVTDEAERTSVSERGVACAEPVSTAREPCHDGVTIIIQDPP